MSVSPVDPAQDPATAPLPTVAAESTPPAGSAHRVRRGASLALIVIGCLLLTVGLATSWARRLVQDEDAYVRAVGPLATNADVVTALSDDLSTVVINQVDKLGIDDGVTSYLSSHNVPPVLVNLASDALAALRSNIDQRIQTAVNDVVNSPAFATIWVSINQIAHRQFQALVNGSSALLDSSGGLSIPLDPLVSAVRQRLVNDGMSWAAKIPDTDATISLMSPDDTAQLRTTLRDAKIVAISISVAAILLLVLAVVLAVDRWRAVRRIGYGTIIGALFLALALNVGRHYVGNLTTIPHPAAAQAILDTVLDGLRVWIRVAAAIGIVLIIVALSLGSDRLAHRWRSMFSRAWTALTSPRWRTWRRAAAGAVAAVVAGVLVFGDAALTGTIVLIVILLIALFLVWVPGRADPVEMTSAAAVHL